MNIEFENVMGELRMNIKRDFDELLAQDSQDETERKLTLFSDFRIANILWQVMKMPNGTLSPIFGLAEAHKKYIKGKFKAGIPMGLFYFHDESETLKEQAIFIR